jgi:hypothetical protein
MEVSFFYKFKIQMLTNGFFSRIKNLHRVAADTYRNFSSRHIVAADLYRNLKFLYTVPENICRNL